MKTKRTTIRDIAEAAGVSISLVSFVMNNKGKRYRISDEMTKRIREMADKLDYQPNNAARSLRSGRSRTIGVVVSDISNSFLRRYAGKSRTMPPVLIIPLFSAVRTRMRTSSAMWSKYFWARAWTD